MHCRVLLAVMGLLVDVAVKGLPVGPDLDLLDEVTGLSCWIDITGGDLD